MVCGRHYGVQILAGHDGGLGTGVILMTSMSPSPSSLRPHML